MVNKQQRPKKLTAVKIRVNDLFEAISLSHELHVNMGADVKVHPDHIVVRCGSSRKTIEDVVGKIVVDRLMSVDRRIVPLHRQGAA
jgi:hypothetical protein